MTTATKAANTRVSTLGEYEGIRQAIELYNEGARKGKSEIMKPAFHEAATFFGYYEGNLLAGSAQILFDWIDANGPIGDMRVQMMGVEIHESIAVVNLEMENVTGKLAGQVGARLSDLFQLIKIDGEWKISQKSFHWHTA